jgi:release factor glutamine methyltransferase
MSQKTWQAVLSAGGQVLAEAGVEGATRDARWLLAHALEIAPDRLTLILPDPISPKVLARFDQFVQRRCGREPVSHILGAREFYGRRFMVSADVLDPRPESEMLVEVALEDKPSRVLDLGTGSACLLLSILAECPNAAGVGSDLSEAALAVAIRNSERMGLTGRAAFVRSDWFGSIGDRFDLIIVNPPYIAASEMADLQPEVRDHEPRMALTDEGDGLGAYRMITAEVMKYLNTGGRLVVEIGPTQGDAVVAMFEAAGLHDVEVRSDLNGRDRVVLGAQACTNT